MQYYNAHPNYLHGIASSLSMLNYFESHKDKTYNVIKTTRAGFTTNCILSSLYLNKRVLLVAPTNKILYETIRDAYKIYRDTITHDMSKVIRPIPNNKDGCSCVVNALKTNPQLEILPYISSDDCASCSSSYKTFPIGMPQFVFMSNQSTCVVKTMLEEHEQQRYDNHPPDVLTITYDKFSSLSSNAKDTLFKSLIDKVDIIVFDEIGDYLSKSFNGFEFFTEITDCYNNITKQDSSILKDYFINTIPLIKSPSSKKIITHLLKTYIFPFLEKSLTPASSGSFPRLLLNPLTFEPISDSVKLGPVSKQMSASKQVILSKKYREYYQVIEDLAIAKEPTKLIELLIHFLDLMTKKQFLLYEQSTTRYHPTRQTSKSLFISSAKDELVSNLNNWSLPDKTIIFSDATMPSHNLQNYTARKIKNIFYGDPAKNNKSLLMFHDPTIPHFSKTLYFNNVPFRNLLLSRIETFLSQNYYGNEVIWCPSKDIATDLSLTLNRMNIPTCTHLNPDPNSVLITYFGSIFTRGVKSERRFQIILGKANKPKNSFKHIAYMRRADWDFLSPQDLNQLSAKENIPFEEFKDLITDFNQNIAIPLRKTNDFYNDLTIFKDLPPNLTTYFQHFSDSIQKEKTYMDTWQAASRAKNPTGETRSVNVCIGWTESDLHELLQWGSNTSISYSISTHKRLLKTQRNSIPTPPVISNPDISFIRHWLSGCEIPQSYIGFNESFLAGFRELIIEKERITLEELWSALQHNNLEFSHSSDTFNNGYLIGAVNALLFYDIGDDITVEKVVDSDPTSLIFEYTPSSPKPRSKRFSINTSEYLNILEVLRAIHLFSPKNPTDPITYSDIRNFISKKKIPTSLLHELWEIIIYQDLFAGSTWLIPLDTETIIKTTSPSLEQNHLISQSQSLFSGDEHLLVEHIINWYYNEPLIHEIDVFSISDSHSSFYVNSHTHSILSSLLSSPSYLHLQEYGLNCDIEKVNNNIILTRNTIVY